MKLKRIHPSIVLSSIALLIVLVIQVNWILRAAETKEELFNEKANMILSRTTEALRADKETCRKINACMEEEDKSNLASKLGRSEVRKIDSLFNHYMKFYNFDAPPKRDFFNKRRNY